MQYIFNLGLFMPHYFANQLHGFLANTFILFEVRHGYPNDYLVKEHNNFEMKVPAGNVMKENSFFFVSKFIVFDFRYKSN